MPVTRIEVSGIPGILKALGAEGCAKVQAVDLHFEPGHFPFATVKMGLPKGFFSEVDLPLISVNYEPVVT